MKKTMSKLLAIVLSFLFIFQTSFTALANDEPDWVDAYFTQEEFEEILSQNVNNQATTFASGLIYGYAIGLSGSGTNLYVAGKTTCDPDVVKCGFTVVTIKRRTSSTASWTTYKTYEDLYISNCAYTLAKTISVPTGYQYRVYCTHYAKKNLFSTEKINNTSNIIAIG